MKESSLEHEIKALEVRKVAISKRIIKNVLISVVYVSLIGFAFSAGYIGTFLLFK